MTPKMTYELFYLFFIFTYYRFKHMTVTHNRSGCFNNVTVLFKTVASFEHIVNIVKQN